MANTIQIKRSSTGAATPTLAAGELGVNIADQKLWLGDGTNNYGLGGSGLFLNHSVEYVFTEPGTYTVKAPTGSNGIAVTYLSAVCVGAGGGGGGGDTTDYGGGGGGGGGLSYVNQHQFNSGETLTVIVGAAGTAGGTGSAGSGGQAGGAGGNSEVKIGSTSIIKANGGGAGALGGMGRAPSTWVNNGGSHTENASYGSTRGGGNGGGAGWNWNGGAGGGGAGGFDGNGATGADVSAQNTIHVAAGGTHAGGAGSSSHYSGDAELGTGNGGDGGTGTDNTSGGGGGGAWIWSDALPIGSGYNTGEGGVNGINGTSTTPGFGSPGGFPGGGGGGSDDSPGAWTGGAGGNGAVRLAFGPKDGGFTFAGAANMESYGSIIYLNGVRQFGSTTIDGDLTARSIIGKPDSYTKLLLHSDTTDDRGTFTDSSPSGHALTTGGAPTHQTNKSKFGASSLYFDGDDGLHLSANSDWDFGTGDFTIDYWVSYSSFSVYQTIWDYGYVQGLLLQTVSASSGSLRAYVGGGSSTYYVSESTTPALNTWYHYAVVRSSGVVTIYRDGVNVGSATRAASIAGPFSTYDNTPAIGVSSSHASHPNYYLNGYIDEFRISKGIARWTAAFTPPTRPYATFSAGDGAFTGELSAATTLVTPRTVELTHPNDGYYDTGFISKRGTTGDAASLSSAGGAAVLMMRGSSAYKAIKLGQYNGTSLVYPLILDGSQNATFSGDVSVGGNLAVTGTIDCDTLDSLDSTDFMRNYGIPSGSDQYINARVIRNLNAGSGAGMHIGYGNQNSGNTMIYGGGGTTTSLTVAAHSGTSTFAGSLTVGGVLTGTAGVDVSGADAPRFQVQQGSGNKWRWYADAADSFIRDGTGGHNVAKFTANGDVGFYNTNGSATPFVWDASTTILTAPYIVGTTSIASGGMNPIADDSHNLGNASYRWKNLFISDDISTSTISMTGALTGNSATFSGSIETTSVFTAGSSSSSYAINVKRGSGGDPYIRWSSGSTELGRLACGSTGFVLNSPTLVEGALTSGASTVTNAAHAYHYINSGASHEAGIILRHNGSSIWEIYKRQATTKDFAIYDFGTTNGGVKLQIPHDGTTMALMAGGGTVNCGGALTAAGDLSIGGGNFYMYSTGNGSMAGAFTIAGELFTQGIKKGIGRGYNTAARYPLGHYTPGETVFEIDPTWTDSELQTYFNSSTVSFSYDSTAPGGYAIYLSGGVWVGSHYGSGFPHIPVDQDDIIYCECWIRNVGTVTHYMGSIDMKENFAAPAGGSGNPGSYGYWVMSGTNPGTSWVKKSAYISGFGDSTGEFETGTKFFTPMALFNYGHSAGTRACYISGWKYIKVKHHGNRTFTGTLTAATGAFSGNITGGGTAIFTGDLTCGDDLYLKAANAWIISGSVGNLLTGGTLRIQSFAKLRVDGGLKIGEIANGNTRYTSSQWCNYLELDAASSGGGGIIWGKQSTSKQSGIVSNHGQLEIGYSTATGTSDNWYPGFTLDDTNDVGIGTTTPGGYKLYVNGTSFFKNPMLLDSTLQVDAAATVNGLLTGTGSASIHKTSSTTDTDYKGAYFSCTGSMSNWKDKFGIDVLAHTSNWSHDEIFGVNVLAEKSESGSNNVYGVRSIARCSSTASNGGTKNFYGLYGKVEETGSETITTGYSVYAASPTGSVTNAWGFYQAGDAKNQFGGPLGIGADPGSYDLYVSGTTYLAGTANVTGLLTGSQVGIKLYAGWGGIATTLGGGSLFMGFNVEGAATGNVIQASNTHASGAGWAYMRCTGYTNGISFHTKSGNTTAGEDAVANERMRIDGSGNVSIGVGASPGGVSRLESMRVARTTAFNAADGDTWHDLLVRNPTNSENAASGIAFIMNNSYHKNAASGIAAIAGAGSDYSSALAFITRPHAAVAAERMRIHRDGGLGIGTTDPGTYKLYVAGTTYLGNDVTIGSGKELSAGGVIKLYGDASSLNERGEIANNDTYVSFSASSNSTTAKGFKFYTRNTGNSIALTIDDANKLATFVGPVTVGGALTASGGITGTINASTLDSLDSSQFVRSDVNDTITNHTTWSDSNRARFGDGTDLVIYHDGSHSYITDAGTGSLIIGTNSQIALKSSSENLLVATPNGAISLYYDNALKLATQSSGITVTGEVKPATDDTYHLGNASYRWHDLFLNGEIQIGGTKAWVDSAYLASYSVSSGKIVNNAVGKDQISAFISTLDALP